MKKVQKLSVPVSPEAAAFTVVVSQLLESKGLDCVATWEDLPMQVVIQELRSKLTILDNPRLDLVDPGAIFQQAVLIGAYAMILTELAQRKKKAQGLRGYSIPPAMLRLVEAPNKIVSKA